MGPRGFFLVVLYVMMSPLGYAFEAQDIKTLRHHVLEHITEHYKTNLGEEDFNKNIQIHVSNIDSRLRLAKCDDNLTFAIKEPPHNPRNITVKTRCNGAQSWTLYVPATIDRFAEVLVVNRSMERGMVITQDDLDYRRINVATAGRGHIEKIKFAEGFELKRPLKAGETLKLSYLKKPNIVHKGQTVIVSSNSRFLSVETAGVALVSGHMGQNIKVKNQRSNRVVDAKVVAPGKVIVAIR